MSAMPPAAVRSLKPGRPTHHLIRRRARLVARTWNEGRAPTTTFKAVVRKAARGPWRWRVELVHDPARL